MTADDSKSYLSYLNNLVDPYNQSILIIILLVNILLMLAILL